MTYYYLVASLPTLALGGAPCMTPTQFRVLCSEHLEPSHLAELDAVLSDTGFRGGGRSPFAQRWQRTELQIKNAGARVRAQRRGLDPERHVQPTDDLDLGLLRRVQEALAAPNAKARARALDAVRWQELEQLAFDAPFSQNAVLGYALRLDLCARWAARTVPAGRARLVAQVDAMLQHFDAPEEIA